MLGYRRREACNELARCIAVGNPPPAPPLSARRSARADKGGEHTFSELFETSAQRFFSPPLFFAQRSGAKNKGGAGGGFPPGEC